MNTVASAIAGALVSFALIVPAVAQQESGKVGSGPPEDIFLDATLAADGGITLSQGEFKLAQGGYYRFNFECPAAGIENEAGISFTAPTFWRDTHIRIVSVADSASREQQVPEINFHMQGLQVGMIDCEGLGAAARISFFPMRKGTYPFTVINETVDPSVEVTGSFVVE